MVKKPHASWLRPVKDAPTDKTQLLLSLAEEMIATNVTAELAASATQLVLGEGNVDADIVFIGEAPGKQEDIQGRPFVGASGRFLNEMLSAAGLQREDVYITNIVKYRPPDNRDPTPEEKQAFWPYLLRQIEIINPKIIITLGRHSGMYFIPDLRISRDHGRAQTATFHDQEYRIIPLYHPAAALYNGSMRQTLIDDFMTAAQLAKRV